MNYLAEVPPISLFKELKASSDHNFNRSVYYAQKNGTILSDQLANIEETQTSVDGNRSQRTPSVSVCQLASEPVLHQETALPTASQINSNLQDGMQNKGAGFIGSILNLV